jgi:methyl-accepting chemotaxis protein
MNTNRLKSFSGLILAVLSAAGILLVIFGLIQVWRVEQNVSQRLVVSLELTQETLETTTTGLEVVSASLENTASSLTLLKTTTDNTLLTIEDTVVLLDSTSTVVGEEIPATIGAIQVSLNTAEQGARLIDEVLRILSRIPFISNVNYNPETPLNESIAEISESMDAIPTSLQTTQTQLQTASTNIQKFQVSIEDLSDQVGDIQTNVEAMQEVVENYRTTFERATRLVENARRDAPGWVRTVAWGSTAILFWFGIAQAGTLIEGWKIFRNSQAPQVVESTG